MNEEFKWVDISTVNMLVIQRNTFGALRLVQRMPVGGGAPADIPIADGSEVPRLLVALAGVYGVALALNGLAVTAVGFRG